jgi:hypothetical protein
VLDIGSAEAMVFMPGDPRQHSHLEGFGAVAQGMFAIPSSGPPRTAEVRILRDEPGVPREGRMAKVNANGGYSTVSRPTSK